MTEEHKRKIGESVRRAKLGKSLSADHRRNLSLSRFGRPHPHASTGSRSDETRNKIGASLRRFWDGKGRRTSDVKLLRSSSQYANWRSQVFERDGYRCVECGVGGDLNADHIVPLSYLAANNPDAIWDIGNGRTLCVPCHRATPTFGKNARYYRPS